MTAPAKLVYTPTEAAQLMSMNKESILRAIRTGDLEAKRWGHGYRIKATALDDWFNGLESA